MTAVTTYGVPRIRYLVLAGMADVSGEGYFPACAGRPEAIGVPAAPPAC